jgi:hypothetical protein
MSDPQAVDTVTEQASESPVSAEIGRAVSSIFQRRGGTRPTSVETKFQGDAIRCVIADGEPTPEETAAQELAVGSGTDTTAYRHEAAAAVTRITKRHVNAYIAKRDEKAGLSTQTFILEPVLTKY